jgi:hypothetical protein
LPPYYHGKMLKGILNRLACGLLVLITFSRCEQTTVTDVASADAFIKTIVNQGDTLFGVAHSVFSYNGMTSVSVKSPDGDSIQLPGITGNGISIYKDPSLTAGDYSKTLPSDGVYKYDVTFRDKSTQALNNTLGADFILPAVIDSLGLSPDGQSVVLKWNPVQNAQFYQIRVTKGNAEVIPAKLYSPEGGLEVQFPISFFSSYKPGTFTIELDGLLFESTAYLLLQAMSVTNGSLILQ